MPSAPNRLAAGTARRPLPAVAFSSAEKSNLEWPRSLRCEQTESADSQCSWIVAFALNEASGASLFEQWIFFRINLIRDKSRYLLFAIETEDKTRITK
jgi:hypothetical protein